MTVRLQAKNVIALSGQCGVEEAEELQRLLLSVPESTVDWADCESLHAALVQVLLVARPGLRGEPSSAFLERHVAPLLRSRDSISLPDSNSPGEQA